VNDYADTFVASGRRAAVVHAWQNVLRHPRVLLQHTVTRQNNHGQTIVKARHQVRKLLSSAAVLTVFRGRHRRPRLLVPVAVEVVGMERKGEIVGDVARETADGTRSDVLFFLYSGAA